MLYNIITTDHILRVNVLIRSAYVYIGEMTVKKAARCSITLPTKREEYPRVHMRAIMGREKG